MALPAAFDDEGLLPPGDYELTLGELKTSMLVVGPTPALPSWDAASSSTTSPSSSISSFASA